jgi:hypothetical protein
MGRQLVIASLFDPASLPLASDVPEDPGQAVDGVLHGSVFTLGRISLKPIHCLIVDNLGPSSDKRSLWNSHVVSFGHRDI